MRQKILLIIPFLLFFTFVFAEPTSIEGLYRYRLDNGLELFVAENDSAPLAYIEIAVRAGAVTQTPENAGLFHLYEHMMFKGNAKYENQDAFTEAANEMGRIDENGSTGIDRVNYFFTVPSSQVRKGLEFWSYAVRTPKLDENELENEKAVVLSEINADFTDPAHIRNAALNKAMFPKCPWRVDPAGNPVAVKNATQESLRQIQEKYYIPANSAIFVGGDVDHDEIFQYVTEIYSDWKNPEQMADFDSSVSKTPLSNDKKMVFVNPGSSDAMIHVVYYLRGPDGENEAYDTYSADVWNNLVNDPNGIFAKTFVSEKSLSIPESSYVGASYPTRRLSGLLGFYGTMLNTVSLPAAKTFSEDKNYALGSIDIVQVAALESSPVEKAENFLSVFKKKAVPAMSSKESFFKDKSISFVIQQLEDSRIYENESAKSILASLSFFWSACSSDYYFSYDQKIAAVKEDDVVSFVQKYMQNKNGAYIVTVSPGIWEQYKTLFIKYGYEQITAENSFWQKTTGE